MYHSYGTTGSACASDDDCRFDHCCEISFRGKRSIRGGPGGTCIALSGLGESELKIYFFLFSSHKITPLRRIWRNKLNKHFQDNVDSSLSDGITCSLYSFSRRKGWMRWSDGCHLAKNFFSISKPKYKKIHIKYFLKSYHDKMRFPKSEWCKG